MLLKGFQNLVKIGAFSFPIKSIRTINADNIPCHSEIAPNEGNYDENDHSKSILTRMCLYGAIIPDSFISID